MDRVLEPWFKAVTLQKGEMGWAGLGCCSLTACQHGTFGRSLMKQEKVRRRLSPASSIKAHSISIAGNGKFMATVASHAISFLDTSPLAKIGTAIQDRKSMRSIAISSDSSQIVIGRRDGKVIIHNLANFLPDSYGPFHVSICPFIMLACLISTTPMSHIDHYIRHSLRRSHDQTRNL